MVATDILPEKHLEIISKKMDEFVRDISGMDCSDMRTEKMKDFARSIGRSIDISTITPSDKDNYDRNILARHQSGWEIMLIGWSEGDQTKIHGHPEMCCYFYIKGSFRLEIFELCPEGNPILKKEIHVGENDSYADCGDPDTFCNHIHRVTCLSPIGFSINLYSDDARKGEEYTLPA